MEDFIETKNEHESPSFYTGWSSGQEAIAEYLRDNPKDGKEKLLEWLAVSEEENKEAQKRLRPYTQLLIRIMKECREQGHTGNINLPCLQCMSIYTREAMLLDS